MTIMYGIPNCNTVKKARQWLEENGIAYEFHDFKKKGVPHENMQQWVEQFGWEKVLNRAGMTWRKLDDAQKASITDAAAAMELMQEKSSIIKRPILDVGNGELYLGFKPEEYAESFKKAA